jgi:acyl-CoA synthetase (AMP-forming)/AMP-acid ligase II
MNIRDHICEVLQHRANDVFLMVSASGRSYSYAEFWSLCCALANELSLRGVKPSDRVVLQLENSAELAVFYFACLQMGAVAVPLGQSLSTTETSPILAGVRPKLLVHSEDISPSTDQNIPHWHITPAKKGDPGEDGSLFDSLKIDDDCIEDTLGAINDENLFSITFTSGTTGRPKGVGHSVYTLFGNALAFNKLTGFTSENRLLHVLPMTYMAGFLNSLLSPFIAGGSVVIAGAFNAMSAMRFWDPVIKYKVNTFWISPSIASAVTKLDRNKSSAEYSLQHMRQVFVGTAPLPLAVKTAFQEKFGVEMLESYGLSEHLYLTANSPLHDRVKGAVGKFLEGIEMRLLGEDGEPTSCDEGVLEIKTPYFMIGYLDYEKGEILPVERGQWLETGDIAKIDAEGNMFITGRVKDLIIRGGMNISPRSIEDVIVGFGPVQAVAVVGLPDPDFGEKIAAAVIWNNDVNASEEQEKLLEWCRNKMPRDRIPTKFTTFDSFPLNANGKIVKTDIRHILLDQ